MSPSSNQPHVSNHSHAPHARHTSQHATRRSIPHQPPNEAPQHNDSHERPLRTPFSIIAILNEQRGREIVDMLGEHSDDLMAAALSLDQRGMTCRRVLELLDNSELRTVAAMWLPLDVNIPPIGREELIAVLCDLAHD